VTLLLYLAGMWILLRNSPAPESARGWMWIVLALGFPAVFVNLMHGQNGFLTAALLAGALALLDERPLLAGCLLGLLAYKPQFGLMIPIALLAEGRWRTIAAAVATVLAMVLVTTAAFGIDIWRAFFESLSFTRTVALEQGGAGFFNIQSVFAWVRLWHGPMALAYTLQLLTTAIVGVLVFRFWRSGASRAQKGAVLCIASLVAAPYWFDYDMMVLAPAVALLAADGFASGFRPWRKAAAASLWFVPLAARPLTAMTAVPVGVLVLIGALILLTWRSVPGPQLKPVS
jgi:alpha-1,2-mannosyltransferase